MPKKYKVGYGKPPKHSQYKTGQSGNPKGKPKGCRNFSTDAKEVLKQPTRVTQGGKSKTLSTQRAMLLRRREQALGGNERALDRMMDLAAKHNNEEFSEEAAKLSLTDEEVLKGYNERLLRDAGRPPQDSNGEAARDAAEGTENAEENDEAKEGEDDDWLR